jgi:hypothetical protein
LFFDLADEVVAAFLEMTAQQVIRLVRHSTSPLHRTLGYDNAFAAATTPPVSLSAQARAWAIHLTRVVIGSSIQALFSLG